MDKCNLGKRTASSTTSAVKDKVSVGGDSPSIEYRFAIITIYRRSASFQSNFYYISCIEYRVGLSVDVRQQKTANVYGI